MKLNYINYESDICKKDEAWMNSTPMRSKKFTMHCSSNYEITRFTGSKHPYTARNASKNVNG